MTGILFLVQFSNFDQTMYELLLELHALAQSAILMRSWLRVLATQVPSFSQEEVMKARWKTRTEATPVFRVAQVSCMQHTLS